MLRRVGVAVLLLLALACERGPAKAQSPPERRPRVELIRVGAATVEAEIVASFADRERGLMHRTQLGESQGMLFIFAGEQPLTFWMKNTLIPLDIGFFDESGHLVNVLTMQPDAEGTPDNQRRTYSSGAPAMYALEMNAGWFARHGMRRGAQMVLPEGIRELRGD